MDFVEGEWEAVTVCDVVFNECAKEWVVCGCALVVPEGEGFMYVGYSLFFGNVVEWPVRSFSE